MFVSKPEFPTATINKKEYEEVYKNAITKLLSKKPEAVSFDEIKTFLFAPKNTIVTLHSEVQLYVSSAKFHP